MKSNFMTKTELQMEFSDIRHEMRAKFTHLSSEMNAEKVYVRKEFEAVRTEMRLSAERVINQLTSKMIQITGLGIATVGLLLAISSTILGLWLKS